MTSQRYLGVLGCWALIACGVAERHPPPKQEPPTLPTECRALTDLPAALLVDDFEDEDELLDPRAGLAGLWYVENDGSGRQEPPAAGREPGQLLASPGAPGSDSGSLHTSGGGFTRWGAFVGVRLNEAQSGVCTADLSASKGLAFSARGRGAVRVNFASPTTTPLGDGGECDSDACSDFGAAVTLEEEWRAFEVGFDQLTQPDWASPSEWQPERLVRLSFWAEQSDFALWLDEIRFF